MRGVLFAVYNSKWLTRALKIASKAAVVLTLPVFILLLYKSYTVSPTALLRLILIMGVPFVLVTALRKLLNLPRPYEVYDFYEAAPKNKCGESFPSRHVFSITLIGTVAVFPYPAIGISLLAVGTILAASRVLLGMHFIRDVLTGALIGAFAAIVGVITLSPFT